MTLHLSDPDVRPACGSCRHFKRFGEGEPRRFPGELDPDGRCGHPARKRDQPVRFCRTSDWCERFERPKEAARGSAGAAPKDG